MSNEASLNGHNFSFVGRIIMIFWQLRESYRILLVTYFPSIPSDVNHCNDGVGAR